MIRKMAIRQTVMDRIVKGTPIILPIQKTHMISTKINTYLLSANRRYKSVLYTKSRYSQSYDPYAGQEQNGYGYDQNNEYGTTSGY